MSIVRSIATAISLFCLPGAFAQAFSDDFNAGPSPSWGNDIGNWSAAGGVYSATSPSNFPNAHSSLPSIYSDVILDVDVNAVQDGGVWVRSSASPDAIGRKGVLLVTGPANGVYWHVVNGGYGASLSPAGGLWTNGTNVHIRVTAIGNAYSVYVNGSGIPASTLIDNTFASGQVALYDFSGQSFDNFSVVPEPGMLALGAATVFVAGLRRRG